MGSRTDDSGRAVLLRLTSLRAAAALMVFAFHAVVDGLIRARPGLELGYTGVAFFFVLSGFVLTWSLPAQMTPPRFWRNRFARIYPVTLVSVAATLVVPVTGVPLTVAGVAASVILVQAWIPKESVVLGGNLVTWSLSCEAAFYAALPFVAPLLARASRYRRVAFAVGYWIAASLIVAEVSLAQPHDRIAVMFVGYSPAIRFGEFLVGAVLAIEVKDGWRMTLPLAGAMAVLSVVLVNVGGVGVLPNVELVPLFVAVIALAAQRDLSRPRGLMTWRPLVYAGEVSFCFYLVHNLVAMNLRHFMAEGARVAAAALVVSWLVAALLHHAVELPCQRLIRGRPSAALSIATHPTEAIDRNISRTDRSWR